jgi:TolB-like protein
VVSDATLTQCVVELRQALGDAAQDPKYIETIPKVGFRLVAPVESLATGDGATTPGGAARQQPRGRFRGAALLLSGMAVVVLVVVALVASPSLTTTGSPVIEADEKSVAVLPFVDASPERDHAWFADGLATELIARLAGIPELKVIGQSSTFRFRDTTESPRAIAEQLGVRYLLEGSVQKAGQRVRITAMLVDAESDFTVWSEVFDSPYADFMTVQDEISESVLTALSVSLKAGQLVHWEGGTTDVEAFEAYQKAWDRFARSPEAHLEGIRLLERAIELDPQFALAWVGLASFYHVGPMAVRDRVPIDWMERSQEAIREARHLAPDSPIVLAAAIDVHQAGLEWAEIEHLLSRANPQSIELHPTVLFSRGVALMKEGRAQESLGVFERARTLDPLRTELALQLAHAYYINGRIDAALEQCAIAWDLAESPYWVEASVCLEPALSSGSTKQIRLWLDRLRGVVSEPSAHISLAMAERLGDRDDALAYLREALQHGEQEYWIANWAAYFGDTRLAVDAVLRRPDPYGLWNPLMAEVRRQPEFPQALEQLGLIDYWREFGWPDYCRPLGRTGVRCE